MAEADIPGVEAFLFDHIDTSVYLASTLRDLGIRCTSNPRSGDFLLIEDRGALAGVCCLTARGDLLAQAGGRIDLAEPILAACRAREVAVVNVLAEGALAEALWARLMPEEGFVPVYECESIVYGITRVPITRTVSPGLVIRPMDMADYDAWQVVDRAFCADEGLTVVPDEDRRRAGYQLRAEVGGWWGAFTPDGLLVSTTCLNAEYRGIGQIGGVYTRPAYRRLGIAQRVMHELMRHHEAANGLEEVVLFTAVRNGPARAFYESMGFMERGRFGILFRQRREQA